ncbi:MAG: DUF1800 domain-containing protein [Gemmatimonadaceae bacterium]
MRKFSTVSTAVAWAVVGCAPSQNRVPAPSLGVYAVEGMAADAMPREQTADQQIRHALSRAAFGARPGDYDRVRSIGLDRWIALQLEPRRIEDRDMTRFLSQFPTLALSTNEMVERFPPPQLIRAQERAEMPRQGRDAPPMAPRGVRTDSAREMTLRTREDSVRYRQAAEASRGVLAEAQIAKVARAVASERQLEEVMTDFWSNHFSVYAQKGATRYFITSYERDVIRPHALGNFRQMLGAVARSPAMLFYLDNWQSSADSGAPRLQSPRQPVARNGLPSRRKGGARRGRGRDRVLRGGAPAMDSGDSAPPTAPRRRPRGLNENYAREILELHTLGVDGGYTQQDVINVARALTGWTLENPRQGGGFVFRSFMHDAGEKKILGVTLKANRGIEDGEQVLDIVARHPSTARHIATKLARRFVSDSPSPALIDRAAATFTRTDGDIREVVRTILTSPEFFSRPAYRSKVKSPFELVVSALRAIGAEPDSTPRTALIVARLGQPLWLHQAPNGYPETGESWINTGAILNRINFGLALAGGRIPGASLTNWAQADKLASSPREQQVDGVITTLLGGDASPDTRSIMISGSNPMLARAPDVSNSTDVMRAEEAQPMMDNGAAPRRDRGRRQDPLGAFTDLKGFAQVVGLALGSPEFQRR